MNLNKALLVAKAQIKWQKDGVPVPYEQLNSELLAVALKVLVDNTELLILECDGMAVK